MGRLFTIAVALLVALGLLVAAMAWSTAARGQEPGKTEDVLRVEHGIGELAAAKRAVADKVAANKRAAARALAKCEKDGLAKRARQFPPTVEADYMAGHIYNRMARFVEDTKRTAARKHWGSRYDAALLAARDRLIELGGNEGYATLFSFGHSLRG
ncbi:MAG: hypothetical protein H0T69_01825 [Thermoleophilaceae bacterium]|nr:hypothetical protein [Thermoleophilaceae bacterium]